MAAVAVAAMIAKIGFDLALASAQELIDTALDSEKVHAIRGHVLAVAGVRSIHTLRTRKSGGNAFVDVHIQVDPHISVSEGHQIGDAVRKRLLCQVDEVTDVMIHIDPENDETDSPCDELPSRNQIIAALKRCWPQLPETTIEAVTLHYLSGEIDVELNVPIEILPDIQEAKQLVQQLKQAAGSLAYVRQVQVRFII